MSKTKKKEFVRTQLDFETREEDKGVRRAARQTRAALKSSELGFIRERLATSVSANISRAADHVAAAGPAAMPQAAFDDFTRKVQGVARAAELDERLAGIQRRFEKRAKAPKVKVSSEPRVYGKKSPHSYFADLAATMEPARDARAADAQERMARYDRELAFEVRRGSKEGKRVQRLIGEKYRQEDVEANRRIVGERRAELRAGFVSGGGVVASAGSGAASFVTPYFALSEYAPFRGIHRTFADQCNKQPLPPFGLQVYLPAFTSAVSATQQTEGAAVSETDPTTGLQGAAVVTVTGQLTLSQQLSDRGFTGGGSADIAIGKQLQQSLDEQIEKYVLTQALAGAATVAGQATFSIANLYQDLALAREKLTDTAGTRLRPTHLFTTSDLFSYVTRQVDDQHRPILVPQFVPGFPLAAGDEQTAWSRFTGAVLPGSLLWFTADGIPTVGTVNQTQLIVSAPDESVVLFEGDPILWAFPQTGAASFEVILNLRAYVAAIARIASGTATVYSAAYLSSLA